MARGDDCRDFDPCDSVSAPGDRWTLSIASPPGTPHCDRSCNVLAATGEQGRCGASAKTTKHVSLTVGGREEAWWEPLSAIAGAGLVVAEWAGGSFDSLRYGVSGVDSNWYHMPLAAVFAESGSVLVPHNINNDNVIELDLAYVGVAAPAEASSSSEAILCHRLSTPCGSLLPCSPPGALVAGYGVGSLTTMAACVGTGDDGSDRGRTLYRLQRPCRHGVGLGRPGATRLRRRSCGDGEVRSVGTLGSCTGRRSGPSALKDTFVFPVAALTIRCHRTPAEGSAHPRQGLSWWCRSSW